MTDLVVVYKFTTLLTFELSSFRENSFFIVYISHALATDTSRWTSKTAWRPNRENWHTYRHTGQLL